MAQCSTFRHLASDGLGASGSAIISVYRRLSVSYATFGRLLTCRSTCHLSLVRQQYISMLKLWAWLVAARSNSLLATLLQ